ncbi:MAG: hypothetical protein KGJ64_06145, partial [Betaproteobacteria bacterium]|nr:hypothetical protein [Betaproteobacteria bacterium]
QLPGPPVTVAATASGHGLGALAAGEGALAFLGHHLLPWCVKIENCETAKPRNRETAKLHWVGKV